GLLGLMAIPGSVKYPGWGVKVITLELGAFGGSCAEVFPAIAASVAIDKIVRNVWRTIAREIEDRRLAPPAEIFLEFTNAPPRLQQLLPPEYLDSSSSTRRRVVPLFMNGKVSRRRHSKEIVNEIIPAPADQVRIAAFAVVHVRNDQLVEILVGFDEGISQAHGFHDMHVLIDIPMFDEQVAFQAIGHGDIGLLGVIRSHRITLIEFVPPRFVEPRVVIAGNGHANLVEIGKGQDGVRRAVASGGGAVNADAIRVHVRKLRSHLLDHFDVVFKRTAEVVIREFVEAPRTTSRAAAINHHSDEAKLGNLLLGITQSGAKCFWNEEGLRAGVNHFDDGIFL